jgi:hypothetical protein
VTLNARAAMATLLAVVTASCDAPGTVPADRTVAPDYLGVSITELDPALVQFVAEVKGVARREDATTYARCAAAGYAVSKGFGFVRHVRTKVSEQGGIWRADAVYTISPNLPDGLRTIDAEVTVSDCTEQGFPTG